MHLPRPCPECHQVMQALSYQRGPRSPRLELQRCPGCGGLWFDAGELEDALARRVNFEPLDATVERRCATCRVPMTAALLEGGVPVETCQLCRGTFLDHGELSQLGGRERPSPAASWRRLEPEADAPLTDHERLARAGFTCAACHQRKPLTHAAATSKGLVCQGCAPQVQEMPAVGGFATARTPQGDDWLSFDWLALFDDFDHL